jgi:hypothetical protein
MFNIETFFAPAKQLSLSSAEHDAIRAALRGKRAGSNAGLSASEQGEILAELKRFTKQFPHRYAEKDMAISITVWHGPNILRCVQPFRLSPATSSRDNE